MIQPTVEKMGTKRSILADEKGLPLSVVLSGANTHDIKLLEEALDKIVISRPAVCDLHPQNLCLDAGYTGSASPLRYASTLPIFAPEVRGARK